MPEFSSMLPSTPQMAGALVAGNGPSIQTRRAARCSWSGSGRRHRAGAPPVTQEAFALARSRASRRRSRRSRRRLTRSAGCRSGGTGASSNTKAAGSWTKAAWIGSGDAGRASMNSRTSRPLEVSRHPPLTRSTSPWDQMSRFGIRSASRLVRSAQSRPLVARIAMSRLRSSMTANPSG